MAAGYSRDHLIKRLRASNPNLAKEISNLQLDWYRIKNATSADTAEIFIYQEIDPYWGMSADDLVKELNDVEAGNIDVRINSPGGSVFDCVAIYNALVKHSANIRVYVDSLAASGASIIAMAGDEVIMMVGSQMMIHDALGIEMGNAADMRAFADFLDKQSDNLASIYAAKAGGDVADWRALMLAETWMFAEEAVEMGLADKIYSQEEKEEETTEPDESEEEEESTEEESDEELPEDEEEEGDEELENLMDLMTARHTLVNRGFKYAGRRRAPKPIENQFSMDSLIDNMLAGRK
jgi:ATP-dependent protease ClpP protease subunit